MLPPDHDSVNTRLLELYHDKAKWQFIEVQQGVRTYRYKRDSSPIHLIIGELEDMVVDVEFLRSQVFRPDFQREFDPMLIDIRELVDLNGMHKVHEKVIQASFKLPWPMSDRDFVWREHYDCVEDLHFVVGRSIEHPDAPPSRKYVRAEIQESGLLWRETAPGRVHLVYMVQVDPKGLIPNWLVNLVAADQALNVARMRDFFARHQA
eukprot:gnl/Spiro4/1525_TR825_c0_g1_i1.p1 gnl/Spiro4/1525_TR825_c0_g1~~gnl/Spiro4/1525_TR825_c0_g1_i1.p1  ORF type:complete len:220 (-),score=49.74 gnl/Spiro4/1525_TR825_c0_g1_i1:43-663(-)